MQILSSTNLPYILIVLTLLGLTLSCSQIHKSDQENWFSELPQSLQKDVTSNRSYKKKTQFLLAYCSTSHDLDYTAALAAANLATKWAKSKDLDFEYAQAMYWLAYLKNQEIPQGIPLNEALSEVKIAQEIFRNLNKNLWLAKSLNLQALLHYNLYEEERGAKFNDNAIMVLHDVEEKNNEVSTTWGDIFRAKVSFGLYYELEIDTLINYLDKSYQYYVSAQDSSKIALTLLNYAIIYRVDSRWENSDSLFDKSIKLYDQLSQTDKIADALLEKASMLADRFKITQEEKWFLLSNKAIRHGLLANPSKKAEFYFQLAANYNNQGIYRNQPLLFDSAAEYYQHALDYSVEEKNPAYLNWSAQEVGNICVDIGTSRCQDLLDKTALAYQAIVDETRQSLMMASAKMEEFMDEQARDRQNRIYWYSFTAISILLLISILAINLIRTRSLQKQDQMRLRAMRSQMNPHFISNSLNAIDSLIFQKRADEASEYIVDFSRLCRQIIDYSFEDEIPLWQELETLKHYLSLEKLRMKDKLNYNIKLKDDLDLDHILIPPMILQPYVENAINHGIHNLSRPGHLLIKIEHSPKDSSIMYTIEDDGVGRKKAMALRDNKARVSHGLKISQSRIEAVKKTITGIVKIEDLFDDAGNPSGTRVSIKLPLLHNNN